MSNPATNPATDTPLPPRPTGTSTGGRSVLAADVVIKGDITADGIIEVLGEVDGKISARTLIVGGEGRVKGIVTAETVEVRGRLEGRISCVSLTLRAASSVKADSSYSSLIIESGAQVDGRFTHAKS